MVAGVSEGAGARDVECVCESAERDLSKNSTIIYDASLRPCNKRIINLPHLGLGQRFVVALVVCESIRIGNHKNRHCGCKNWHTLSILKYVELMGGLTFGVQP